MNEIHQSVACYEVFLAEFPFHGESTMAPQDRALLLPQWTVAPACVVECASSSSARASQLPPVPTFHFYGLLMFLLWFAAQEWQAARDGRLRGFEDLDSDQKENEYVIRVGLLGETEKPPSNDRFDLTRIFADAIFQEHSLVNSFYNTYSCHLPIILEGGWPWHADTHESGPKFDTKNCKASPSPYKPLSSGADNAPTTVQPLAAAASQEPSPFAGGLKLTEEEAACIDAANRRTAGTSPPQIPIDKSPVPRTIMDKTVNEPIYTNRTSDYWVGFREHMIAEGVRVLNITREDLLRTFDSSHFPRPKVHVSDHSRKNEIFCRLRTRIRDQLCEGDWDSTKRTFIIHGRSGEGKTHNVKQSVHNAQAAATLAVSG